MPITPRQNFALVLDRWLGVYYERMQGRRKQVSVSLDLEKRCVFPSLSDLDEMTSMAINSKEGTLYMRLWRPADRLLTQIAKLEQEARALAFSVLVTQ